MKALIVSGLAILLVCPMALAYEKIETYMPMAPTVEIEGGRTIAFIGFTTSQPEYQDEAKLFASMIEEFATSDQFAIDKIDGGKYSIEELGGYLTLKEISTDVNKLLDRGSLDALDQEIRDNQTGMIDESKMVEAGNRFGVEILVTGHLSFEDRSKDDKSEFRVSVSMKLTDVETSSVLHTFTEQAKHSKSTKSASLGSMWDAAKDQKVPDADVELDPGDEVIDQCLNELAAGCTQVFNPYLKKVKYDLEKLDGHISKDEKKEGDRAAKMAADHSFSQACAVYTKIFDKNWDANSAFNLATLYEVSGDMDKALEFYDAALEGDSGNKRFREHRERMGKTSAGLFFILDRSNYRAPGLECGEAGGRSTRLKGETVQLFDGIDGTVVREIPGGREVELLEENGDWCRIKIMGKELWVRGGSLER